MEALVPSLLLQPLIENAVKYAVSPSERGGTIRVEGRTRGAMLELAVADDGPGLLATPAAAPGAGRGVGLRNTRERLAVLYDDRHRFATIDNKPGLRIELGLPLEGWRRHERMQPQRKLRTLLVDDEALSRRGLELRLRVAERHRDHRPVQQRPRGAERDPRAAPGPRVPRHPDAGTVRLRRARASCSRTSCR